MPLSLAVNHGIALARVEDSTLPASDEMSRGPSQQTVRDLAEKLAEAHAPTAEFAIAELESVGGSQPHPILRPTKADLTLIFVRLLSTGVGIFASISTHSHIPLQSALLISTAGALVSGGSQLYYRPISIWQTHLGKWNFRGGLPHFTARIQAGPSVLLIKEFSLQLFFYSVVQLSSHLLGVQTSLAEVFHQAWTGLVTDGIGNILIASATVAAVAKMKEKWGPSSHNQHSVGKLRKAEKAAWIFSKSIAAGLSFFATAAIISQTYGSESAHAALGVLAQILGAVWIVKSLTDLEGLKEDFRVIRTSSIILSRGPAAICRLMIGAIP